MRLFVHVHHGIVDVYKAETLEDLQQIHNMITRILDELCEEYDDTILRPTEKTIDLMIDTFGIGEHETFEWGTGFNTIRR